jgi:hypothetical protein
MVTLDGAWPAHLPNREEAWPQHYVLHRDALRVENPTLEEQLRLRAEGKVYRSALDLEREERLYQRLAHLVSEDRRGRVSLCSDWRERAVEFANLYAPPVDYRPLTGDPAIPLACFAREAFLLWWMLRLLVHLKDTDGSVVEALKAFVQIEALVPELGEPDRGGPLWFEAKSWQDAVTSAVSLKVGTPRRRRELHKRWRELPPLEAIRPLPSDEVKTRVKRLCEGRSDDRALLWNRAGARFATVLNIRLAGVSVLCLPRSWASSHSASRSLAFYAPVVSFHSLSPRARIWFGLWEEIGGSAVRSCPECGTPFTAKRRNQVFCTTACQNKANVRRWRETHPKTKGSRAPRGR